MTGTIGEFTRCSIFKYYRGKGNRLFAVGIADLPVYDFGLHDGTQSGQGQKN